MRLLLGITLLASVGATRRPTPRGKVHRFAASDSPLGMGTPLPTSANCTWVSYEQTLDHFARGATRGGGETFSQRLCFYDGFVATKGFAPLVFFCKSVPTHLKPFALFLGASRILD